MRVFSAAQKGRYQQVDPLHYLAVDLSNLPEDVAILGDARGANLEQYSYARNNPVIFTDPTGLCECGKKAWKIFLKCAVVNIALADLAMAPGFFGCTCAGPAAPECVAVLAQIMEMVDAYIVLGCTVVAMSEYTKCPPCRNSPTGPPGPPPNIYSPPMIRW